MLVTIGFLVGEKVEGSSLLFDAQISGPAITHITQVDPWLHNSKDLVVKEKKILHKICIPK
jgi:hypothetical protein